ncbi:MAG: RsmE family RNA methyltransferase [Spirochaetaceae bacterium]
MNIVLLEPEELSGGGAIRLPAGDRRARHICSVLRLSVGQDLKVGLVNGSAGRGRVRRISAGGDVELDLAWPGAGEFGGPGEQGTDSLQPVRLLLAHPRPIVLRRVLRDLSTLGVERIVVCHSALGEKSYFGSSMWEGDMVRRLLIEGAEQAGVTVIPAVERRWRPKDGIEGVIEGRAEAARLLFDPDGEEPREAGSEKGRAAAPDAVSASAAPRRDTGGLIVAVGAERGWTEEERRVFVRSGFRSRSLGGRILRTETAAVAAVVLALRELGRLPGQA